MKWNSPFFSSKLLLAYLYALPKGVASSPSSHSGPGHPPGLPLARRALIPELLWHGPEACEFPLQVWTCGRVAKVIEPEFGLLGHAQFVSG